MQEINNILDAKLLEYQKSQEKRNYLGASMIGEECLRKIQLQYMHKQPEISAKTLRTFDIGHCLEDLVANWLRIAGFYLLTKAENGEQFGFSVAEGKIAGHIDGIIQAFPKYMRTAKFAPLGDSTSDAEQQAQRKIGSRDHPWLWECKTLNSRSWSDLNKRGVMISKPIYYAQIQLYMAYMELEKCLFTALNKDSSELYFEVVPFDSETAQKYSDRAVQVLKATENNELMPCISGDSSFYLCKMCGFRNECQRDVGSIDRLPRGKEQ